MTIFSICKDYPKPKYSLIDEDSNLFLSYVYDFVSALYSLYDDIPKSFFFSKYNDRYTIFIEGKDEDIFEILKNRNESLYNDIFYIEDSVLQKNIECLYIKGLISFDRKILNRKIYSHSQIFYAKNMSFKNNHLFNYLLLYIKTNNNTYFSRLQNRFLRLLDILKMETDISLSKECLGILKEINTSRDIFGFEKKSGFSFFLFLLKYGNSSWLYEIGKYIDIQNNLEKSFIISLLRDDFNALSFLIQKGFFDPKKLHKITEEDKSIIPDKYWCKKYLFNEQICLLSLSVIFHSYSIFLHLIRNKEYDIQSFPDGENALFYAIYNKDYELSYLLVNKGINIHIENRHGKIASEYISSDAQGDILFEYIEVKRLAELKSS